MTWLSSPSRASPAPVQALEMLEVLCGTSHALYKKEGSLPGKDTLSGRELRRTFAREKVDGQVNQANHERICTHLAPKFQNFKCCEHSASHLALEEQKLFATAIGRVADARSFNRFACDQASF